MLEFTIQSGDGPDVEPLVFKATSRDVLTWEKLRHGRSFTKLMDDLSMTELYALAHIAARRLGHFGGSLREFEETFDLDFDQAIAAVPTQPAR